MAKTTSNKPTGQVNTWEAEMAQAATIAAKANSATLERSFINFGNGTMSLDGANFPNNEAAVVVLESLHANLYYPEPFDASKPVSPDCYAFGRPTLNPDDTVSIEGVDTWNGTKELAPHKDCTNRVHDTCKGCPMQEFGTALVGKGKACQDTRRIAVIPAGTMQGEKFIAYTKPEQIASADIAYAKLPFFSAKNFSAFVMNVARTLARPTWGVFARMARKNDPRSQFVVEFSALAEIPNALGEAVMKKMREAKDDIAFPFPPNEVKAAGPKKAPRRKYT